MIFTIASETDMGTVKEYNNRVIEITPETWAPGLWAGVNGVTIAIGDRTALVVSVDLNKRRVEIDKDIKALPGEIITAINDDDGKRH